MRRPDVIWTLFRHAALVVVLVLCAGGRWDAAATNEKASLQQRDTTLEQAERHLRGAITVAARNIYGPGTKAVEGITEAVSAVVLELDPTGLSAMLIRMPEINRTAEDAIQSYLRGDDAEAERQWAKVLKDLGAEGAKLGAEYAHLEALDVVMTAAEIGPILGEVGRQLATTGNAMGIHDALMRQLGKVTRERTQIRARITEIDSEVSGASFDPATLSSQAQANRKNTERNTLLTLIDRAHRDALERVSALINEQWRVQSSNETVNASRTRLAEETQSTTAALAAKAPLLSPEQLKRVIPEGWIPCQCPGTHPHAGLLIDDRRWHTSALNCSMAF